ncbi:RidA family protein [Streptomyces sp. NBC_00536]|uniref:RidA family protein n=1 Tax=Streptomyces sp. NBC_00536 TaxID=2975769 RepID=UPI002E803026|nr:RidA family protein [Streptomyces sp. NBC_00536]WUC76935.1 RidA family protein [Streptomyces sp. NBC_00536]
MMQHFVRPDGTPPVNGYSHAVAFTGPMIAVSGQVPVDAHGRVVGAGDTAAQVRQVFANLVTALEAAGAAMDYVVKLTVFLTNLADLDTFRQVRDEYLDTARPPACSLVKVAGLVHPAFRVEIDALAVLPAGA